MRGSCCNHNFSKNASEKFQYRNISRTVDAKAIIANRTFAMQLDTLYGKYKYLYDPAIHSAMTQQTLRILIAEDHSVVRLGTRLLIADLYPAAEVEETTTFDQTLWFLSSRQYQLILLDINLPGGDNIHMVQAVRVRNRDIRILVFSSYEEDQFALSFMDAGADGYVHKNAEQEEVKAAIRKVMQHEKYLSPRMQQLLIERRGNAISGKQPLDSLTIREREVLHLLLTGADAPLIKEKLNIRDSTVSTHKANLFKKLKVSSVIELAQKIKMLDSLQEKRSLF